MPTVMAQDWACVYHFTLMTMSINDFRPCDYMLFSCMCVRLMEWLSKCDFQSVHKPGCEVLASVCSAINMEEVLTFCVDPRMSISAGSLKLLTKTVNELVCVCVHMHACMYGWNRDCRDSFVYLKASVCLNSIISAGPQTGGLGATVCRR